jgi:hypothetical protein
VEKDPRLRKARKELQKAFLPVLRKRVRDSVVCYCMRLKSFCEKAKIVLFTGAEDVVSTPRLQNVSTFLWSCTPPLKVAQHPESVSGTTSRNQVFFRFVHFTTHVLKQI